MKIIFLVIALVLSLGFECSGQHMIGVDKSMITSLVRKEMKGFNLDKSVKNENFNYLKFVNSADTKTLLVFFDGKNISTKTRLICDYSELDLLLDELNKAYKKTGENSWEYAVDNDKIEVTLEKKEWYFVVSTKKK
jgi:DNA repair exonuclease SbcCD nuclease subunit